MEKTWQKTIHHLQERLPAHAFNTWIKPLSYKDTQDSHIFVEVPNNYYRDRLQSTYSSMIKKTLRELSQDLNMDVSFVVSSNTPVFSHDQLQKISQEKTRQKLTQIKQQEEKTNPSYTLYPQYTFDQFVVGTGNQFAHAAAQSVASQPGQQYNPLFLYGGVGLGKTHLLCAIGHQIKQNNPGAKIIYETCEQFTNGMINAIRYQKTENFRNRYRKNCDLLLLDDIQFLSKKERTQEEFFHTFNVLHQQNIQIVVTSDELPKNIPDIDERLRSRFEWGLMCDIQAPDLETRVAILEKKISDLHLDVDQEVLVYLAEKFQNNIRALEGALTRLSAQATLSNLNIDKAFAQKVFSDHVSASVLTLESIMDKVANFFMLSVADLKSSSRKKNIALPRQVAMFLCRKHTRHSFPEIGQKFGGKDHTTIMHAVKKIEELCSKQDDIAHTLSAIEKSLR